MLIHFGVPASRVPPSSLAMDDSASFVFFPLESVQPLVDTCFPYPSHSFTTSTIIPNTY